MGSRKPASGRGDATLEENKLDEATLDVNVASASGPIYVAGLDDDAVEPAAKLEHRPSVWRRSVPRLRMKRRYNDSNRAGR